MSLEQKPLQGGPRICLDFGTALSKASVFLGGQDGLPRETVRPLAIGAAAGAENPFLAPSVMFVDDGRVTFGPAAFGRAERNLERRRDPILSFKSILSARDVEEALALKVRPSVDPTASLTNRDLFVLYLAFLDQLTRTAILDNPELPDSLVDAPRRYTNSIWRARRRADRVLAQLFGEASVVSQRFDRQLLDAEGVSLAQALDVLSRARQSEVESPLEAGVFEAYAAAAAYAAFAPQPASTLLLVDIGGGTTDIAGFDYRDRTLTEIETARQVSALAGDEVDALIIELATRRLSAKSPELQEKLWRMMRLHVRALKRDLFARGSCSLSVGGRQLQLKRDDLLGDKMFKTFRQALASAIGSSLEAVVRHARATRAERVAVTVAGGGANLPFVIETIRSLAQAHKGMSVSVGKCGDQWLLPLGSDPLLSHAAAQVAISMGGALVELSVTSDVQGA